MRAAMLIFVAMLLLFVPVSTQMLEPTEMEQLDVLNRKFYVAMKEQASEADRISLERLVPVEWDRVIACDPYAGAEEMWRLTGSRFSDALSFSGYNEFYIEYVGLCNNNDTFLRSDDPYLYVNFDSTFAQVCADGG